MLLLMLEVDICGKEHVAFGPWSNGMILCDPFIHKGKIMVLIPKARVDMQ